MGQLPESTVNEVLADRQTTHLQMRYATWSMSQNCAFCAGVHGSSGGIAGRAESPFGLPDNEMTQLSPRPSNFDGICTATHEYALGQRPLFGNGGRRQEPGLETRAWRRGFR